MLSEEYKKALDASNKASEAYRKASLDYHARKISDEEFISAVTEYKKAALAFDEAFAKEQKTGV